MKPFHKNKKRSYFFNMSISIINSFWTLVYIWSEMRLCSSVGLSFEIYNMLISHIHIFHVVFNVLKLQSFKFRICNSCYQCVLQHVQLVVVELVTYCRKYCLIKRNKNYWSIYKPIFNSRIGNYIVSTTFALR